LTTAAGTDGVAVKSKSARILVRGNPAAAIRRAELDAFVQHLGRAIQARQRRQGDTLPGRCGPAPDVAQHLAGAATQRDEVDTPLVDPGELRIRGQLGIEDDLGGIRSGVFLPEVDEVENFCGLLRLGNAGAETESDNGDCQQWSDKNVLHAHSPVR
jgi:hypothetical protein